MSHEGTGWAIRQRGLKPTTRIVLWHLADRHNPDFGCFPSQERLADDAEISRSTLNEHLGILEERGLIRREARQNDRTKRQMSTRYILAFEPDFTQDDAKPCPEIGHGTEKEHQAEPCPEIGHGAVSGKTPEPCPENGESRVRIPDTNLVREPLREPLRRAEAREGVCSDRFDDFWAAYPNPIEETAARRAWAKLPEGADLDLIISRAAAYADDDRVKRGFAKAPANWLRDRCWEGQAPSPAATGAPADLDALAGLWAPKIIEGRFVPPSAISVPLARHMRTKGLVTEQQLRRVGVSF
ncbi:helix-turn-helix domain-containing protein [Paracoccus nototheniae]|uniref:Helix-turn-helix domain-containing protein n=1 Tax=Paracoccus nototheniae TaxID=2489002 RepID=A0ABW4DX81_9RHOB|nr:helix-turn-helix domain-containing protein [Paracoccus nototheniae]